MNNYYIIIYDSLSGERIIDHVYTEKGLREYASISTIDRILCVYRIDGNGKIETGHLGKNKITWRLI